MSSDRGRQKGRRGGGFFALPHHVFRASGERPAPVAVISPAARAFLIDLCAQFNGRNNGNLSAAPKIMRLYGWKSGSRIDACVVELVVAGFLTLTRQGGRNRCSLYAVTWLGIDEGPHEVKADPVPSNLWHADKADQRDQAFISRWQKIQEGRRGEKPSLYAEKPSLYAEKSTREKAA